MRGLRRAVAAALLLAQHSLGGDWEDVHFALENNCMKSMATCHDGSGSLLTWMSREECIQENLIWFSSFESTEEFKTAAVAARAKIGQGVGAFLVRVTDQGKFLASAGRFLTSERLYCEDGSFAVLDAREKEIVEQVEGIDFHIAMPSQLKVSPSLTGYESMNVQAGVLTRRVILLPSARDNAEAVLRTWKAQHSSRRRLSGDQEDVVHMQLGRDQKDSQGGGSQASSILVSAPRSEAKWLDFVAEEVETLFISPLVKYQTLNFDAAMITHTGTVLRAGSTPSDSLSPFWAAGITGKTQVVGVGDSGLDMEQCYFRDPSVNEGARRDARERNKVYNDSNHRKVIQYFTFQDAYDVDGGHGTHVVGTIAGYPSDPTMRTNGGLATVDKGIAYEAKIAFADLGNAASPKEIFLPENVSEIFEYAYEAGARVHSNSWGGGTNEYGPLSSEVDRYTFVRQDYLMVFAAGNGGFKNGGTLEQPASSKNVLAVGASLSSEFTLGRQQDSTCKGKVTPCSSNLAETSSNGPSFDGRIKPDLVAPGVSVVSAAGGTGTQSCNVNLKGGTSMAVPAISANAVLIREFFNKGFYPKGVSSAGKGFEPMGALLKAALIHSGTLLRGYYGDIPLSGQVDFFQGFGVPQLDKVLLLDGNSVENAVFFHGDMSNMPTLAETGDAKQYRYVITSTARTVRVTLTWFDPPAALLASKALVNDLDVKIIAPSGREYFPNQLTSPDTTNNVEQITLPVQELEVNGELIVEVKAGKLNQGPQPFALVVSGSLVSNERNSTGIGGPLEPQPSNDDEGGSNGVFIALLTVGSLVGVAALAGVGVLIWKRTAPLPPQQNVAAVVNRPAGLTQPHATYNKYNV